MAKEYKQNISYEDILKDSSRSEATQKVNTQNKYSLPYGLCAKYGISLPNGATPTDAWNALKGIGIKPSEVYKDIQIDGKLDEVHPTGEKVKESKSETQKVMANQDIDTEVETTDVVAEENSESTLEDAYSQERKNNALNSTDPKVFDKMARKKTFEIWKSYSHDEKFAAVDYTGGYSKYNEPLRGIEYGTSKFKGEGNIDMETIGMSYGGFKKGEVKKRIDALTSAIEKSSFDKDVILRRGTGYSGMDNFFKGVSLDLLKNGTTKELTQAIVGNTYTDGGFTSCGSSKGKGFSGDINFSIYAPKGTKMLYVEPVSSYGAQYGINWNGEMQSSFKQENETVIQRGSSYRVTEVKRLSDGKLYVRMEVVSQKKFN